MAGVAGQIARAPLVCLQMVCRVESIQTFARFHAPQRPANAFSTPSLSMAGEQVTLITDGIITRHVHLPCVCV